MSHAPDHNRQSNEFEEEKVVASSAPSTSSLFISGIRKTFGKLALLTAIGTGALAAHPADAGAKKPHVVTQYPTKSKTVQAKSKTAQKPAVKSGAKQAAKPISKSTKPAPNIQKPQAPKPQTSKVAPEVKSQHSVSTFLSIPKEKIDRLIEKYNAESVAYALRIIENGHRIKTSHDKEQNMLAARAEVQKKFSSRVKIPKWFGYIDDPREFQQVVAMHYYVTKVMKRGKQIGLEIDVDFLIGVMSNEGSVLNVWGNDDDWETPVDGFGGLGLDWFAKDFESIAEMGLIDANFKRFFKEKICTNEKCNPVSSADFKNKGAAINAVVAELAYRQKLAFIRLNKMGIDLNTLTPEKRKDVVRFLTYLFYNAGPGSASEIIKSCKTAEELYGYVNRPQTNPWAINLTGSPANCYVVMAGSEWLSRTGATDPDASKKSYWWNDTSKKKVAFTPKN